MRWFILTWSFKGLLMSIDILYALTRALLPMNKAYYMFITRAFITNALPINPINLVCFLLKTSESEL